MRYWKKITIGLVIIPIVLFAIFYAYFAISMINTNSQKSIDANIASECITDLKNSHKDLKNVELYYYQGKIFFDINFENNLSSDESKIVINSLKEFILKDNISNFFSEKYEQMPIRAIISSKYNSYYYTCPYYLMTKDNSDFYVQSDVKSDYKIWYSTYADGEIIEEII